MVDDAATAALMARAMRYPPDGIRGMGASSARASGYGSIPDYARTANAQVCLLVQAESRAALNDIDAIAATPAWTVSLSAPPICPPIWDTPASPTTQR
jgi:2,4-dihydroxyhept-2-ene-1,7-dioic acid aldolase